mmetsp:Transcript_23095/g.64082  ORF Transcript_23095/g.64082 Transcript_23095/m.64082 type:complete len:220 (+) Transcript_23095:162-821(+)
MSRRLFTSPQSIFDHSSSSWPILATARARTPLAPGNSRVTCRNMPPGVMLPTSQVYGEPSMPFVSPRMEPKPAEELPRSNAGPLATQSCRIAKTFLWSFLPGWPPGPVKGSAAGQNHFMMYSLMAPSGSPPLPLMVSWYHASMSGAPPRAPPRAWRATAPLVRVAGEWGGAGAAPAKAGSANRTSATAAPTATRSGSKTGRAIVRGQASWRAWLVPRHS